MYEPFQSFHHFRSRGSLSLPARSRLHAVMLFQIIFYHCRCHCLARARSAFAPAALCCWLPWLAGGAACVVWSLRRGLATRLSAPLPTWWMMSYSVGSGSRPVRFCGARPLLCGCHSPVILPCHSAALEAACDPARRVCSVFRAQKLCYCDVAGVAEAAEVRSLTFRDSQCEDVLCLSVPTLLSSQ